MNNIIYIEDRPEDFDLFIKNIATAMNDLIFHPKKEDRGQMIDNIRLFLDPFGDSPEAMKNEAKSFLDESLAHANGFIIDFELEGNSRTNVTGCRFYEEYILNNEKIKDCNILFLTRFKGRTSTALRDLNYKITTEYDSNKVRVNSKHDFESNTVNSEIIKKINDLFLSPNF